MKIYEYQLESVAVILLYIKISDSNPKTVTKRMRDH